MKTIRNQPIPQDGDVTNFPDGQIQDETDVKLGTPVVRAIYGDMLVNMYKIVRYAGLTPTETEDGENTQYQLLDALKVFANEINDLQQLLTVDLLDINVSFNFDALPENYIFLGKVSEEILTSKSYTINGTGSESYAIVPNADIPASSLVIVTLNSSGSTMISLNSLNVESEIVQTPYGAPLSYNDSSNLLYLSAGNIIDNFPTSYLVENKIQVFESSFDVKLIDAIIFKGKLICLTQDAVTNAYKLFSLSSGNLNVVDGEIIAPILNTSDNVPYMYCDGSFIYFTNSQTDINEVADDNILGRFSFNENTLTLTYVDTVTLNANFTKTTNVFITDNNLYSLINGDLFEYDITSGAEVFKSKLNVINGVVFKFKNISYYTNGNTAVKISY